MADKEILILRGETLSFDVLWETDQIIYKPITAIDLSHGAPRLTAIGHGAVSGWYGAVTRVLGMRQINAESSPPSDSDYHRLTVIDVDTVELNDVDASGFSAYTSGGFLQFNAPQDLTGYTARMQVRTREGGELLMSSDVADTPLDIINLTVSASLKKTTIEISAADTAAIPATVKRGVTSLEMVSPIGVVKRLKITRGAKDEPDAVRVAGEVTT